MHVLARALYDNNAEALDELSFYKGDIITVIEQNTSGLEGWWLCSLNGRQGIAPGNRLKLLAGMYESPNSPPPSQTAQKIKTPQFVGDLYTYDSPSTIRNVGPSSNEDYDIPQSARNQPAQQQPGYQTVPGARRNVLQHQLSAEKSEDYDVLPSAPANKSPSPSTEVYLNSPLKNRRQSIDELYDSPKKREQEDVYDTLPAGREGQDIYDTPPMKQTSVETNETDQPSSPTEPKIFLAPPAQFAQELELYDTLPGQKYPADVYDVPSTLDTMAAANRKRPSRQNSAEEIYNSPMNVSSQALYDSPSSSSSGHLLAQNSNQVYDIPPQVTRDKPRSRGPSPINCQSMGELEGKMNLLSTAKFGKSRDNLDELGANGSDVDLAATLELLSEKRQVLETAVAYLMSYVSSTWRHQSNLEPRIHEIQSACKQLKLALEEFLEFADQCVATASAQNASDILQTKLGKSVHSLRELHTSTVRSNTALDAMQWQVSKLIYKPGSSDTSELDQFALSARSISEDMKQFVTLILENASALFCPPTSHNLSNHQERPLPTPPHLPSAKANWPTPEKESIVKGTTIQSRPLPQLPGSRADIPPAPIDDLDHTPRKEGQADYGYLTKRDPLLNKKIMVADDNSSSFLCQTDKQILAFYVNDVESLINTMSTAIDVFFTCIEANQPPKVFVAHSKHIILIGHKLVFIGDTLHHNLQHQEVGARIIRCSDSLCDCLNVAVNITKTAALQYPAVQPLQEMVDRITDAANATQDLKAAILQYAAM